MGFKVLRIVVLFLIAALSACARIEISQSDGSVLVEQHLGVLSVELQPRVRSQLIAMWGAGLVAIAGGGIVVGFHSSDIAVLPPDDCRIVIWVKNDADISGVRRLVGEQQSFCVVGDNFEKTRIDEMENQK